ncbi:protein TPX2 isoform X12 [Elaeis guineensis]|uniref:Protein TPX2 isoform X2 n=1 Tax=Elaeis guineensis var. tenera TaxID=51953 RepID=A0A6I9QAI7_ELAGV|nr:protein TPX2 isoform X2 [Elaeis guineensis]
MDDDDEMEEAFEEGFFLGFEIDLEYEFDAARYFDFGRAENPAEARAAELWFETAGSYPPSPLVVKVNFKKYIPIENGDTHSNLKDSECANPINAELDDGIGPELSVLYDNDKGLEHACMLESVSKVSSRSITKGPFLKDSTLMKPTASQLAKQNQPHVKNANASRSRKTAAVKSNRKQDPSSYLHQAAKRQKLESGHLCKALHILNARTQLDLVHKVPEKKIGPADFPRLKLTIPKEPVLETARRARNFRAQRSSNAKHLQEGMVPTTSTFKARPLNRKILEAPSLLLAQKSTPRMPNFKEFNLRTRERAIQHCSAISSSLGDVTESKRFEHENSGPSKLSNDDKKAEDSRNVSSIFKARPLNNKIFSGKGDFGIFRSTKRQITIPKEFNFSTTERCEQAPLTELFNKLSLASEGQQTTASQTRFPPPAHVATKDSKENLVTLAQK